MRRLILLAGLALAVGVLLPAGALSATGGSDLPVKGSFSGQGTLNRATGQEHLVSTGTASHFGLSHVDEHGQIVPTGPGAFVIFGTWTLTGANSDQMFGTFAGSGSTADNVHYTLLVDYASTGGTGRFADATMTFVVTVESTVVSVDATTLTSAFDAEVVGRLSYR